MKKKNIKKEPPLIVSKSCLFLKMLMFYMAGLYRSLLLLAGPGETINCFKHVDVLDLRANSQWRGYGILWYANIDWALEMYPINPVVLCVPEYGSKNIDGFLFCFMPHRCTHKDHWSCVCPHGAVAKQKVHRRQYRGKVGKFKLFVFLKAEKWCTVVSLNF